MVIVNHAISDQFEILTSHPKYHVSGIGDVDLRYIDLDMAKKLASKSKGLLKRKEISEVLIEDSATKEKRKYKRKEK